jgi:hypothetical protein
LDPHSGNTPATHAQLAPRHASVAAEQAGQHPVLNTIARLRGKEKLAKAESKGEKPGRKG